MGDDGDRITNKDVLNTLTDMKDNHLNHIEKNTEETNRHFRSLLWIVKLLLGALILWAVEQHFIQYMFGG